MGNHKTRARSSSAAATRMRLQEATAMSSSRTLASCKAAGRVIGNGVSPGSVVGSGEGNPALASRSPGRGKTPRWGPDRGRRASAGACRHRPAPAAPGQPTVSVPRDAWEPSGWLAAVPRRPWETDEFRGGVGLPVLLSFIGPRECPETAKSSWLAASHQGRCTYFSRSLSPRLAGSSISASAEIADNRRPSV